MESRKEGHWSPGRRVPEVLTGIPGSRVTEVLRSWSYGWFMRCHVGAGNEPGSSLYEDSVLPTTDLSLQPPGLQVPRVCRQQLPWLVSACGHIAQALPDVVSAVCRAVIEGSVYDLSRMMNSGCAPLSVGLCF